MTDRPRDPDIRFDDEPDWDDEPGDLPEDAVEVVGNGEVVFLGEAVEHAVACRRCGKGVSAGVLDCPYCFAPMARHRVAATYGGFDGRTMKRASGETPPLLALIWFYVGLLATTILWGWFSRFGLAADPLKKAGADESLFALMVGVEIFDAVLVVIACLAIKPPPSRWWRGGGRAVLAWLGGIPLVALLLAANFAYHAYLKNFLGLDDIEKQLVGAKGMTALVIAAVCLQPAIIEELFFRYLALGHLRSLMGVHGAVLISSVMFGLAHLGQPLSVPLLTIFGIGLGYARVWGGGLLLPMVLHFIHNLVVLYLNHEL